MYSLVAKLGMRQKKEFVDAVCSMHVGVKVVLVHHILISQARVSARKSYVE